MTDVSKFEKKPEQLEPKPKSKAGNPNWKKGMPSPNPGGRPTIDAEFRERCRNGVAQKVVEKWIAEVEREGKDWVACSKLLAEYGFGKPHQTQSIELDTQPERPYQDIPSSELVARLKDKA